MKQLYSDLWQTTLERPFAGVNTHAYFLKCKHDNVLIYNTSDKEDIQNIFDAGGIKYQYLSHRDEVGKSLLDIKQQFNSKLCCHIKEEPVISPTCPVDITFSERITHSTGVEIIPTPGHTIGGLSFLYHSPKGLSYLFTGDTFYLVNGNWGTLVFPSAGGSTESLIDSLLIYRKLKPDVVISSASTGDISFAEVKQDKWEKDIDNKISELKG